MMGSLARDDRMLAKKVENPRPPKIPSGSGCGHLDGSDCTYE